MRADFGIIFGFFLLYYAFRFIQDIIDYLKGQCVEKSHQGFEFSEDNIKEALSIKTYGNFTLTKAIALFEGGDIIPKEGYKSNQFVCRDGLLIERLIVSVSAERLLELYDDLLTLIGDTCGIVLEDFGIDQEQHVDHIAYHKDTVVVRSILIDYEKLLLNDGFIGIAVFNESGHVEVQLTDHKVIQVFSVNTTQFREILAVYGIKEDSNLRFIHEDDHIHFAADNCKDALEDLKYRLSIDQSIMQTGDSRELVC